jgi:hypothetical protein
MHSHFFIDRRRMNTFAHQLFAGLCAFALACLPAAAADATHVRAHHAAVQSAGAAQAHGKVQMEQASVATSSRRGPRHVHAADEKKSDGKAADAAKSAHGAKKSERAHAPVKRGHGRAQRQLKVEDPMPMSQAALRGRRRSVHEEIAGKRSASAVADVTPASIARKRHSRSGTTAVAGAEQAAVVAPTPASNDPSKPVTVNDFLRAANGGMLPGEAKAEVSKVSTKPADDGHADTAAASKNFVASGKEVAGPVAKTSFAGISGQRAASRGVPVKSISTATGSASAEATAPHSLPKERVVSGFGSEVDVLPGASPAHGGFSTKNAPADELASHDRALQQQLAEDAMSPVAVPLYSRSGRLMVPAPLKGSHEILVHQNAMADQEGLARIQDDDDLNQMRAAHLLLPLPESDALLVNEELPMNRRCARPWTVKFVGDVAHAFYAKFHEPLRLSSAVRTVEFQRKLQRVNGNAAALEGDTASPHLTGQAIDFAKGGMSRAEVAWMRAYLMPLINVGKIDVEEEFQQSCFHISVYASYAPKKPAARRDVAMRQ